MAYRPRQASFSSLLLALASLVCPGLLRAETYSIVETPTTEARALAARSGGIVADYGTFSLIRSGASVPGLVRENVKTTIEVRGLTFDPETSVPGRDRPRPSTASAAKDLHLVQVIGPATDEWRKQLGAKGVEILKYVPHNAFLVRATASALEGARQLPFVRAGVPYTVEMKLAAPLRSMAAPGGPAILAVDIMVLRDAGPAVAEDLVKPLGGLVKTTITLPVNYFDVVRAEFPSARLSELASDERILGVDPYVPPSKEDERAAQIVAGNYVSTSSINGPGYNPLAQFGADGTGVTVAVVDDGIGIPGDGGYYITAANAADAPLRGASAGAAGHGHLNATIIAGTTPYAPNLDPTGYNYGAGISPKANVTNVPLLRSGYTGTEAATADDAVSTAGPNGVRGFISSNSWGSGTNANAYDSLAAQYDGFVMDASSAGSIDPLLIIFSAGNSGNSGLTRPKVAKNVISVAAGENLRTELAGYGGNPNDNMDEISAYSSRGLAADGRIKPDLAAPGTAITGGRSGTDALFGNIDSYHRWSSGTSHACPQVSGAAALFVQSWKATHSGANPSPALVKAALINGTVPMTAASSGGAIPNGSQGWGRINLKRILNTSVPMTYVNQETAFDSPGQTSSISGSVGTNLAPFRVTLVWTDPPGLSDPALVNDLDLEVTVGGVTYKGNVLSSGVSVTGGSADTINNVENVFLSAGIAAGTPYTVIVKARALNGDGIPGNADTTDQHFALVIYNGTSCSAPSATITAPAFVCKSSTGNAASVPTGADSYAWTITNGTITAGQGTASISFSSGTSGPVILGVGVTKSSCTSSGSATVAVASAQITAPATTCANSTGNTASAAAGASQYTWTISNGSITSGQGTNAITFTAGGSGTVALGLSVTMGTCTDTSTANIPIAAAGSLSVSAPASVCSVSTGNQATVTGAAAPYTWSITNGSITSGQGTSSVTFTAGSSGTVELSVSSTQGACTYTGSKSVSIAGLPSATITAPAAICPNATGLQASAPAGATAYSWSILNGAITAGQGTRQITFTAGFSGSTILSLTVTSSGCANSATKDIPITPPSTAPTALIPLSGATNFTGGFVSWSHAGGVPYDVYFDTVTPPEKRIGTFNSNAAALPVWFPQTTYYWRVVAREACGDVPSAVFSFTTGACPWTGSVPVLTGPADNATGISPSTVVLTWESVPGAAYYALHLGTTLTPSSYRTIPVPQASVTLSLNPATQYYWRVTAYPVCGTGVPTASPVRTFRTAAGVTSVTGLNPTFLNRWTGGNLEITGSGLLGKSFGFDLSGQSAGAFSITTSSSSTVSGTVAASPLSPSGRYDLVVSESSVEKIRIPAALVLRAFTDVIETDYYFLSSARVAGAGIMESDADAVAEGPQFLPAQVLTRAKMAEYLTKSYQWWRTRSVTPPSATCVAQGAGSSDFPDVPCDHPQWLYIHWIKTWGVTTGAPCPEGSCFFPGNSLTRAEMVTFLERLKQGLLLPTLLAGPGETDPGCSQPYPACSGWQDAGMKTALWPRREANVAFADRLTNGCGGSPGNGLSMCPFDPVNRAQVGEFLARAIGLVPNP